MFNLDVNGNTIILGDNTDGIEVELLLEQDVIGKFYNGRCRSHNSPDAYTFRHIGANIDKFKLHTEDALVHSFGISVRDVLDWIKNSKCIKLKFEKTITDRLRRPVKQYFKIGEYTSKVNDVHYMLYASITTDTPLYPLGMVVASFMHRGRYTNFDDLWEGLNFPLYESRTGIEEMTFPLYNTNEHDVKDEPLFFGTAVYTTEEGFTQEVIYGYFKPFAYDGWYLTTMEDFEAFAVAKRTFTYKNGKVVNVR